MGTDPIRVVALAVVRDGKLLTVRKRGTERFMLPGGKPEMGEPEVVTLAREVAEELCCSVRSATLLGEFAAAAANEPGRQVHARVFRGDISGELSLAAEIEAVHWLDLARAPTVPLAPLLQQHVLPVLLDDAPLRSRPPKAVAVHFKCSD
ncbi:NUDIX hydrolase [Jeongeupia chitinilytica]|uniref:MutT/NUDIX family protein n=1 Tax=Jeongeupia chitinilytica TaxID=1041641 RepID=A0ABQ3GZR1_9NEIS|nr:NUDIX domain-containing protein [Jeongeupia chitinilytica]GHD63162.1 MutT/NUDIX family protein [Jeongeupia chitinilytica]